MMIVHSGQKGDNNLKIDSSIIGMESARRYSSADARSVGFGVVSRNPVSSMDGSKSFSEFMSGDAFEDEMSLNDRYKANSVSRSVSGLDERRSIENIKFQCMQYLIYWLFGGAKGDRFRDMLSKEYSDQNQPVQQNNFTNLYQTSLQVSATQYHAESEETAFSTQGKVVTADGREISFNLDLSMSRSFEEYYTAAHTEDILQMMDPLVINLDTNIAGLSDQKFEFDLDSDGIKETLSMLEHGSGYLALDKNGDGIINDGSELFGTSSGDGFKDLAIYDKDGNGWIDENDEIFDKLLIWSKDENGNDELYTLKEAGVGAICLHKVSTDFSLNSLKDNQTNGQIRSTGVFLYENGTAGTMQQLDLAI